MAETVVLRVLRPYADEDAYLAAEAWSIDDKAIVLLEQSGLPKDTLLRFEIVLEDGSKPIRAEGKVHKLVAADGDRPSGLKVRFRRFDASTKRFIDRVMDARRKEKRSRRPPPMELAPLVLDPEPTTDDDSQQGDSAPASLAPSAPEGSAPEVTSAPEQDEQVEPAAAPASAPPPAAPARVSGPGPRAVPAPQNRDELLSRLRARKK